MRKITRIGVASGFCALAVSLAVLSATVGASATHGASAKNPAPKLTATTSAVPQVGEYTLREWQGKVAIFTKGSAKPMIETNIEVSRLREYDRALLTRGIELADYEALQSALEDFSN
jgi:hypothetical protein